MKKILITGENSYIGTSFAKYLDKNFPGDYETQCISVRDENRKVIDFSGYDVVFHTAGIAHSDNGKIPPEKEKLYRSVNTELTLDIARRAKDGGAKQFIFMSSAIIYGNSSPIGKEKYITIDTQPAPANCYADSKLKAEEGLLELSDEGFRIVIIRSPMVYGKNSKGNFAQLCKFASLPLFPKVSNKRSMIYIENLCEFVRLMIDNSEDGIFWPQNKEYACTSEIVRMIAQCRGKSIVLVPGTAWALRLLSAFTGLVNKAFGNMTYDMQMSAYKTDYRLYTLRESIAKIESNTDTE